MTRLQRGLVDNCFEEGHYESGIAVLEQLRNDKYMPSKSHIRQLLYLALYPEKGKDKVPSQPGWAAKGATKQVTQGTTPSDEAISAARQCLMSFALTNSPGSLMRALPSYDDLTPTLEEAEEDSHLAREASRFQRCRDCWQIIKGRFLQVHSDGMGIIPGSPSKRRRADTQSYQSHSAELPGSTVGENAWPILEWLLYLFEEDERRTSQDGNPKYSPLLLSHISPPKSESGAKWNAGTPLDVAFYCLQQESPRRRVLGARLLTLLINLTATSLFDLPLFLNLVLTEFTSRNCRFDETFSLLPPSSAVFKFKLALCQRYLSDSAAASRSTARKARPRAQPRPMPFRARKQAQEAADEAAAIVNSTSGTSRQDAPNISSHHAMPTASEILQLTTRPADSMPHAQEAKFEMLTTYGMLQKQIEGPDRNAEWRDMLRDGRLSQAVEQAFGSADVGERRSPEDMKAALQMMISVW
ncbi:hypothetical protein EWM64_g5136 [Hericium alpestre]|uniref:Uncharacterized protein n=1 Tax=Hericium alpestre TaxID=135208 RepID=A0A4Y9ZVG3_9AGAM|nr:hypothetical protein EWM64_g5136 [Hericium alpestre]